jgi:hypothetical protein
VARRRKQVTDCYHPARPLPFPHDRIPLARPRQPPHADLRADRFSSGLPLYLLLNLVPAWLKTEGLSLKAIGAFALIQFPYTWKFVWSPFLDRYALPLLGRRRGWMALTMLLLLGAIAWLGTLSPTAQLGLVVGSRR